MPIRRAITAAVLTLVIPHAAVGAVAAATAEKLSLTAREIRYDAECPLPRDVLCAIKKPVLSGYRVLTQRISLDDQGSYWIADLSGARQQQGKNESIRILTDNGVLHLIDVKYSAAPRPKGVAKKPRDGAATPTGTPESAAPSTPPKKKKTVPNPALKTPPAVEACYERCRSTP